MVVSYFSSPTVLLIPSKMRSLWDGYLHRIIARTGNDDDAVDDDDDDNEAKTTKLQAHTQ